MEPNDDHESKERALRDKGFKDHLFLIAFGVCLLVALLNIEDLMGYVSIFFGIVLPIFIGVCIAFILNILMTFIEKKFLRVMDHSKGKAKGKRMKGKRPVAIVLTYLLVVGAFTGVIIFVIPQVRESINTLVDKLPGYIQSFNALVYRTLAFFHLPEDTWSQLVVQMEWDKLLTGDKIFEEGTKLLQRSVPQIFDMTRNVTAGFANAIMGIVISIYLLFDKERLLALKDKLLYVYIRKDRADFIQNVGRTANRVFHGFIAGQLIEAIILGTMCSVSLALFQIPYALLIGVLVGITGVIPVFGAFLGALPSAFILLVVNPIYCLIFLIVIIVLQQIENNIIYPRVVGGSIGLSGLWVLVGMMVGGGLFGFMGIILGIPTFAVFYSVFREITNKRIEKMERDQGDQSEDQQEASDTLKLIPPNQKNEGEAEA